MSNSSEDIANKLSRFLPESPRPVELHAPFFIGNEWDYLKQCLDNHWVSSSGKYVEEFEQAIVNYTGAKYAILTNNGTAALHLSLLFADVIPDDEVLMPSLAFIAAANAIRYCDAHPHFVDVDEKTLGVDPEKLDNYLAEISEIRNGVCVNKNTNRPIRALIAMHTFGHPFDIDRLLHVCQRYNLLLIEDAAEALGTYYRDQHVGHRGILGMLSFNGNKIITTGGGGAILTNDEDLATRIKHVSTTARLPHNWRYEYNQVGFNYRMPNINAALGLAQLEKLPEILASKRRLAERYIELFSDDDGVTVFKELEFAKSNYWLNTLLLKNENAAQLEEIISQCYQQGIMLRPVWQLVHTMPMYEHCPRMDLSCSESLSKRIINLPSSASLEFKGK